MQLILKKEISTNKTVNLALGVLLFTSLTALGAYVRIPLPFTPVPLTLQTFFVVLSALFLGRAGGLASQLLYIVLGACGAPLFSSVGAGAAYLLSPTTGYLFGFILAALIIGSFAPRNRTQPWRIFGIVCIADLALLLCGSLWLAVFMGYSLVPALAAGVAPFVVGDLLKAWVATRIFCAFIDKRGSVC